MSATYRPPNPAWPHHEGEPMVSLLTWLLDPRYGPLGSAEKVPLGHPALRPGHDRGVER